MRILFIYFNVRIAYYKKNKLTKKILNILNQVYYLQINFKLKNHIYLFC